MRSKKLTLSLTILLLIVTIGVGIHLLHNDAYAVMTWTLVIVWDGVDAREDYIQTVNPEFLDSRNGQWVPNAANLIFIGNEGNIWGAWQLQLNVPSYYTRVRYRVTYNAGAPLPHPAFDPSPVVPDNGGVAIGWPNGNTLFMEEQ